MITVKRYREVMNDYSTSDDEIKKKIEYIKNFCRGIIKLELNKYENRKK